MGKKCCIPGCRSGYAAIGARSSAAIKTEAKEAGISAASPITASTSNAADGSPVGPDPQPKDTPPPAPTISFFLFPKEPELRRRWIQAIPRDH